MPRRTTTTYARSGRLSPQEAHLSSPKSRAAAAYASSPSSRGLTVGQHRGGGSHGRHSPLKRSPLSKRPSYTISTDEEDSPLDDDEQEEEEDDDRHHDEDFVPEFTQTSRHRPRHTANSAASLPYAIVSNGKMATTDGPRQRRARRSDGKRSERKAGVRKERYDFDDDSDSLSDAPSSSGDEDDLEGEDGDDMGDNDMDVAQDDEDEDDEDLLGNLGDGSDDDLGSDLDSILEAKLNEAGDGESLLGSAASDQDGGDTSEEEERFIIADEARREAKAKARGEVVPVGATVEGDEQRGRSTAVAGSAKAIAAAKAARRKRDDSGSLSPETLRQLGLPTFEDELFEPQDGFNSGSEPSFTDFFGSSDEEAAANGAVAKSGADAGNSNLNPHADDDELTTDSSDDGISDIEGGLLSEPLLAQFGGAAVLAAATAGNSQANGAGAAQGLVSAAGGTGMPDIPLLVIEDLDGRLIYARAGDGEAVFGSDGEFEFANDSDEDETDEEMDLAASDDPRYSRGRSGYPGSMAIDEDSGDTTDELPDEDMPFPRLLIGSVAPYGGRIARRARALAAAKSRRHSPTATRGGPGAMPGSSISGPSAPLELDLTISTEALARDPQGTLEAAARSLGVTVEEAARLLANLQVPGPSGTAQLGQAPLTPPGGSRAELEGSASRPRRSSGSASDSTEDAVPVSAAAIAARRRNLTPANKPPMGSFLPASSKAPHRAVIDGKGQAPSPFTGRHSLQKKGLARKRVHSSRRNSDVSSIAAKRMRRGSTGDYFTPGGFMGGDPATPRAAYSEAHSSPEDIAIEEIDLDDVLDGSLLWRSGKSASSSGGEELEEVEEGDEEQDAADDAAASSTGKSSLASKSPRVRAAMARRRSSASTTSSSRNGGLGLNMNAFARWDKIPMGAFRDGQGATTAGHHQPLGTFLLTRRYGAAESRGAGSSARRNESSPFRGRSGGEALHIGVPHASRAEGAAAAAAAASSRSGASDAEQAAEAELAAQRRRDAFIVSPVLWPVRSNGEAGGLYGNSSSNASAYVEESGPTTSAAPAQPTPKGMVTRREKRERRERAAAMRAAALAAALGGLTPGQEGSGSAEPGTPGTVVTDAGTGSAGYVGSPMPEPSTPTPASRPTLHPDSAAAMSGGSIASPSTALPGMPRLSITDASPRGSPAPGQLAQLVPGRLGAPSHGGLVPPSSHGVSTAQQSGDDASRASANADGSSTNAMGVAPSSPSTGAVGSGSSSGGGALPSSACGVPLHSPLFNGILNGSVGLAGYADDDDVDGDTTEGGALVI